MWMGVRNSSAPLPRSLTPSLMLETQFEMASSRIVIGWVGSRRFWSIQDWILLRFTGCMSTAKLHFPILVSKHPAADCIAMVCVNKVRG